MQLGDEQFNDNKKEKIMKKAFQLFKSPEKTYKTRANAVKAMERVLAETSIEANTIHYIMAVTDTGRFFVVVRGVENLHLACSGLCVVG